MNKNWAMRSNRRAVSLMELISVIVVVVVLGSFAIVAVRNSVRQSYIASEKALMIMLSKAAINYNAAYDRWYGEVFAEDIFSGLLDNPPPHQSFNNDFSAWAQWSTDRKTWKILYISGASPYWMVACPHQTGFFNSTGSSWQFFVKGGKVAVWMERNHVWP